MKNFKKQLENQQKINEAAKAIIEHFTHFANYSSHYESMANAQTEIMYLMELNRKDMLENNSEGEVIDDIPNFLFEVSMIYKLMKPFAEMVGQVYGDMD